MILDVYKRQVSNPAPFIIPERMGGTYGIFINMHQKKNFRIQTK